MLQQIIDTSPCSDMTYLVNDLGRHPFTDAVLAIGYATAGLKPASLDRAHGLRKAGATIAANNGATTHQLMAIFGRSTLKMAEEYTRKANQEKLAHSAMHLLESQN